jgi:membrane peptidoglycan carboxypeptidase
VQDRTPVKLAEVPMAVRHAVLAAEDRTFYQHAAISWRGVARALVSNVTSDDNTQGASTITQQFVKNTYLGQERTVTRKLSEAVLSIKAERRFSKDQILEGYLNTIYFGRGAYGIDSAAKIYFGRRVHDLTPEQGAVLAASIKSPTGYDPVRNRTAAEIRWRYLLENMAGAGWLPKTEPKAAKYPAIAPETSPLTGPNGYIVALAERELRARGITEQQLRTDGLRIVTTIDHRAQAAAEKTMTGVLKGAAAGTRGALVSIQPRTGAIRAYYGGSQGYGFLDYARGSYPSAGTLQPFVRAGAKLGPIQVLDAKADEASSARTLALSAGIEKSVAGEKEIAHHDPHESAESILARYPVTPTTLATSIATVAAEGIRAVPHVVRTASEGSDVVYPAPPDGRLAGMPMGSSAYATTVQAFFGWSVRLPGDRWSVGTSGAQGIGGPGNRAVSTAWASGFTPELATALWLGHDKAAPLKSPSGTPIDGEGTAAIAWAAYAGQALAGVPVSHARFPELAVGRCGPACAKAG